MKMPRFGEGFATAKYYILQPAEAALAVYSVSITLDQPLAGAEPPWR